MNLSGTRYDRIDIWDHGSKQHVVILKTDCQYDPEVFSSSSDGRWLAICSTDCRRVVVWDISTLADCKELQLEASIPDFVVCSCCFSKNSELIIVEFQKEDRNQILIHMCVFDVRTGTLLLETAVGGDASVLMHGVDDGFVSISKNGTVQKWDAALGRVAGLQLDVDISFASISQSETYAAVVSATGTVVVVDLDTMTVIKAFDGVPPVRSVQLNRDGSKILIKLLCRDTVFAVDALNTVVYASDLTTPAFMAFLLTVAYSACVRRRALLPRVISLLLLIRAMVITGTCAFRALEIDRIVHWFNNWLLILF
jgi:WD40 repeat protein